MELKPVERRRKRRRRIVAGSLLVLGSAAVLWWAYGEGGICGTPVLFLFLLPFGIAGTIVGVLINLD